MSKIQVTAWDEKKRSTYKLELDDNDIVDIKKYNFMPSGKKPYHLGCKLIDKDKKRLAICMETVTEVTNKIDNNITVDSQNYTSDIEPLDDEKIYPSSVGPKSED